MYQMGMGAKPLIILSTLNINTSILIIISSICIILISILVAYKILTFTTDEIIAEQVYKKKKFDNSFINISRNRYTVTEFSENEIDEVLVSEVIEAARIAPTAFNKQPHSLLIIKSNAAREKLDSLINMRNAPIAIVVCVDEKVAHRFRANNESSALLDVGVVTTQMMNEANSLGIATSWFCDFNRIEMKEELQLADEHEPICILLLGYPKNREDHSARFEKERKSLSELTTII